MVYSTDISLFQKKILTRYSANKRDLPWRDSFDPYVVLVSETMLQQTQVDRVIPKFHAWMEVLPSLDGLAQADKHTLLSLRSGLGFNSRAIRLQQAAMMVARDGFPRTKQALMALPGVGPYTSGAIMAFAYNTEVAVVDTNIRRVLIRELGLDEDISMKELESIALSCVPEGQAHDRYNALMDYGSLVATAKITGIKPLSKQSKFAGSPRQTRGRILKYLLEHGATTEAILRKHFPHEQFDSILLGLAKDAIIQVEQGYVCIS